MHIYAYHLLLHTCVCVCIHTRVCLCCCHGNDDVVTGEAVQHFRRPDPLIGRAALSFLPSVGFPTRNVCTRRENPFSRHGSVKLLFRSRRNRTNYGPYGRLQDLLTCA